MKKATETIRKIRNHYVGDGFIQIGLAYQDAVAVIGKEGIKFNSKKKGTQNSYLTDERKNIFPYSNIPEHFQLGIFNNYKYVNQILNINEPYIELVDGHLQELYVTQSEEGTFLTTKLLIPSQSKTVILTIEEAEKLYNGKYYFDLNLDYGGILYLKEEKQILQAEKENLSIFLKQLKTRIGQFNIDLDDLAVLDSLINKITVEDLSKGILFTPFLVIDTKEELTVQFIKVTFLGGENKYKIEISDVPMTIANIDYIRTKYPDLRKIKYNGEPKITYIENYPYYTPELIDEENKRAKKLKQAKAM